MPPSPRDRPFPWGLLCASAVVLAAQARSLPGPLRDAASGEILPELGLEFPVGYVATAPFSALADLLTFNSARQHAAWGAWLAGGYLAWRLLRGRRMGSTPLREAGALAACLALFAGFLAWGTLSSRPMARLKAADPAILAVDFHSHTAFSHDGRKSFSPRRNALWHAESGFGAGFITDHNRLDGALQARGERGGYRSLLGVEVSLHDTHVAVLAPRRPIPYADYRANLGGVRRFLRDCRRLYGGVPILSLPEYWEHHWDRLDLLVRWGAQAGPLGIEIVNASPKSLDFPPQGRARAVELARREGLFVAGVSDNHGWSRANYVWNLVRLPGHESLGPGDLEEALVRGLERDGFSAVRVVTRVKRDPSPGAAVLLDPPLALWTALRGLPPLQAGLVLAWLWGLAGLRAGWRNRFS